MTINATQTILMVDDNPDDYEATMRAFRKTNLHNPVHYCESGGDALKYLQDTTKPTPGLILLDLNMPGMDGRKTLEMIKDNHTLCKIPVIILTTSDDERDVECCYELGANTYVLKPVEMEGFIQAIHRLKEYWFEIALLPKEFKNA
jgi:two-component system response regulator